MCGKVQALAWPALQRLHADIEKVFAETASLLGEDIPRPRVTFDLPSSDPEPLHVFTLSEARNFSITGRLTNNTIVMTFDIGAVCVATAGNIEAASAIANAYQSLLLQVPLCDPMLGNTVNEIGMPQVDEYTVWQDADGRRHAGYRLSFNVSINVSESAAVREVLERD